MVLERAVQIGVTGEHKHTHLPSYLSDRDCSVEWVQIPVIQFDRLLFDGPLVRDWVEHPRQWVIFSSPRAVRFWKEAFSDENLRFPQETRVACIGEQTSEAAKKLGFHVNFQPSRSGSEVFIEEFGIKLRQQPSGGGILLPRSEQGRTLISEKLKACGHQVEDILLYRTYPREDLKDLLSEEQLRKLSLILFTSPSSVDAFLKQFSLPSHVKVGSLGKFTGEHLVKKGFVDQKILPDGDFQKIGELL